MTSIAVEQEQQLERRQEQQQQEQQQQEQQQQEQQQREQEHPDSPSDLSDQLGQSWVVGELTGDRCLGEAQLLPAELQGPVLTAAEQACVEVGRRMSSCHGVS